MLKYFIRILLQNFIILWCILGCSTPYMVGYDMVEINSNIKNSEKIDSLIVPYKNIIDLEMNTLIGYSNVSMTTSFPEGLLGNFVSDVMLDSISKLYPHHNMFSLVNNGGLRRSLPEGKITKGLIFEIAPFENEIVILELDSTLISQLADYLINGDEMAIAGGQFVFSGKNPSQIKINNQPINSLSAYFLITVDYLANGGSNMNFLKNAKHRIDTGIKLRDLLIESILSQYARGKSVYSQKDGRIQIN